MVTGLKILAKMCMSEVLFYTHYLADLFSAQLFAVILLFQDGSQVHRQ